jgi:hypothetical protein
MKCSECGHDNQNNPKYCTRCGQLLGAAPSTGGGQVRKTVGMEDMFDAPAARPFAAPPPPPSAYQPPPPPAAAMQPSGQVRRTVLEEGGAMPAAQPASAAMYRGSQPIPAAAGMPQRSKTVLDESPLPAAVQQPSQAGGQAAAPVAGPGTARIVGWMVSYDRNVAGQDYVLRAGRNRIGRGRDNEVSLFFEAKASDTHATLIWRNGNAAVKDEGSTNGTMVNGEDIGIGQVQALQSGDTLTIGGSTFVVFLVDVRMARQTWPQSPWAA